MGLETATVIADLVDTNPTSGDAKSQGDDHIRLLKTVLQTSFSSSASINGYVRVGGTILVQWGNFLTITSDGSSGTLCSFPIAFPNACLQIATSDSGSTVYAFATSVVSTTQFRAWARDYTGAFGAGAGHFIAIGY